MLKKFREKFLKILLKKLQVISERVFKKKNREIFKGIAEGLLKGITEEISEEF